MRCRRSRTHRSPAGSSSRPRSRRPPEQAGRKTIMAITKTDNPLTIAIVGSGYMGGGIAQVLALAGHRVIISDVSAEIAEQNRKRLLTESDQFVADELFEPGST